MSTKKLYLEIGLLTTDATITAVERVDGQMVVRLDQTLFHAQGGGQRADLGTIDGIPVLDVRHAADGDVNHLLAECIDAEIGSTVRLSVDASARLLHSRLHTAGHLIAHVTTASAPALIAKSGHHWPEQGRVEFEGIIEHPEVFAATLAEKIATCVAEDLSVVRIGEPYSSRAIRIGAYPSVGCGGTHVSSLREITAVSIRRIQQKQGVVRISYSVAGEASHV